MRRLLTVLGLALPLAAPGAAAAAGPVWPTMRHDARNTGRAALPARYDGSRPWAVRTGKGIFSTPVIGAGGTVYVGSADRTFLALSPTGRRRWRIRTGGIIDAAAALAGDTVTFGSGDERLYHVRSGVLRGGRRRILWTRRPTEPAHGGQLVRWWEGNVALGPGGDLLTGNTGGASYRIAAATGRVRWARAAGNAVWTTPAIARDGTSYWGSLDLRVFALDAAGRPRWSFGTLGYVVSSPALSRDERTLYVASFDGKLYALDARTGTRRWSFETHDHVYASPALVEAAPGRRALVVIASTDGSVYGVDAATGAERWRYDTGDVVRSSPVVGDGPRRGADPIAYVGAGDGRLYALDAATGRRRWSYDTTVAGASSPLHDRNDLNGSPALAPRGVVIGGEDGDVTFVPYDYCLHRRDARCTAPPFLGQSATRVLPVTAGGATVPGGLGSAVPVTAVLNARLVVRRGGARQDDALLPGASSDALVHATPSFPFHTQLSGDGRVLEIVPDGFLRPGTRYRVRVAGAYAANTITGTGARVAGAPIGHVSGTLAFRTAPLARRDSPLRVRAAATAALELRRIAVPQPSFLTSVNQIGFDDYELLLGTLRAAPGRALTYVITGRRTADGRLVPNPRGGFDFPIAGATHGEAFALARRDLTVRYEFGVTPQDVFALRGTLGPGGRVRPGASLFAEANCARNPTYGALLRLIGLCNARGILPVSGTFLSRGYAGAASRRPPGVRAGAITLTRPTATADGALTATLRLARGARYPAAAHVVSLVLANAANDDPVPLDALAGARTTADARGNVRAVRLRIPRGTALPARLRAFVVADVFPLSSRTLP